MNTPSNELPFYVKTAYFMVALISTVYVLCIGSEIILPVLFSLLIAILLNPGVNFLHRKRVPRMIAIFIVIIITMSAIAGFIYFLTTQISSFINILPKLQTQLNNITNDTLVWISSHFNIPASKLQEWLKNSVTNSISNASAVIAQTLMSISGALIIIFLIPIYVFMILYYKPLIIEFISKFFSKDTHQNVSGILFDSKSLIQSYLTGLLIESAIVSTLNVIGLLIIGVDFAVMLGIIGGLLNIIPYIGGVIAVILPMIIALTTQSPNAALWVLVVYLIVQFIDNNILMHYIVASKVKINALASVIVVLIGAAIWGVPGMFLSIPLTAILKVIFDRVNSLKPFGILLGDSMPAKENNFFKRFYPNKNK